MLASLDLLTKRRNRNELNNQDEPLGSATAQTDTNQPLPRDYQSLYETVTGESLQTPAARAMVPKVRLIEPRLHFVFRHIKSTDFSEIAFAEPNVV